MRFGEWEPVKDSFLPDSTTTVTATVQKNTMLYIKSITANKRIEVKNTLVLSIFKRNL